MKSHTNFEFGKYSTFDDTPKNLIISSDKDNGTVVLWHHESYLSKKEVVPGSFKVCKYLNSLIPRVALVPSIS